MYVNSRIKGIENTLKYLASLCMSTCVTAGTFRCFPHELRAGVIPAGAKESLAVKYPIGEMFFKRILKTSLL